MKTLVLVGFLIAFAAGAVVGRIVRWPEAGPRERGDHSRLVEELQLTPEQGRQMHAIWSDAIARSAPPPFAELRKIEGDRELGVLALLDDQQKARYDQIMKTYYAQMAEAQAKMDGSFREAEEKTKQILTPEQRAKYERLLNQSPRHQRIILPMSRPAAGDSPAEPTRALESGGT